MARLSLNGLKKSERHDQSRATSWRTLKIFFIYRTVLALSLTTLFFTGTGPAFLGQHSPALFALISITYLGVVITSGISIYLRSSNPQRQAYFQVYADIIAITLLMHACGGVTSGLGMLLIISIAAGSAVMRGRTALAFASIASICILGEQIFSSLYRSFPTTSFTQAGILGASFFATAILADALSKSLRESEKLVSQKELDLANLEELNEYIIQHMQTGVIVVDIHERIRLINEYAWYLLGMPDAVSGQLLEQASPELSKQLKMWNENQDKQFKAIHTTPSGNELEAKFTQLGRTQKEGALIYIENTATINMRAQQLKLASLGRLTASIAHEIRNPLGAISHAQQLLDESPSLEEPDKRLNQIIQKNSERVNEIIESIMQLSRRQQSRPDSIRLETWLKEFAEDFSHTHELSNNSMQVSILPKDTQIQADPVQLRQLITNLCENSIRHFHQEKEHLVIKINGGITRESVRPFIEIIDNGPGIKQDSAKQIFEPFFTTRSTGTGLGLYIAKELCEVNNLKLGYKPVPIGGSCFYISFPEKQFRG
jgi:two-component system sensor histidine kinase PilS (NtrC family)